MSEAALNQFAAARRLHAAGTSELPLDWRYHAGRIWTGVVGPIRALHSRIAIWRFARAVDRQKYRILHLDDAALIAALQAERTAAANPCGARGIRIMALVAELAARILGMRPFPAQIRGAAILLSGRLAEMETGSGKTLTAALAAITAAWCGTRVHVITANDYLAERDATGLAPLFEAVGLSVGLIVRSVQQPDRPAAYRSDVVYASNKEIAFDYLRNRILLGAESGPIRTVLEPLHRTRARAHHLTMQGLPMAIVDEADSVLIDECRTPLIISADAEPDPGGAETALQLADALEEGRDYTPDDRNRTVTFTDRGKVRLDEMGTEIGGIWRNNVRRESAARNGIVARRYFLKDEHYIVRDEKVELIDEYTGRIAPDRQLGDGLHQVIQQKENVPVTGRRFTQGRITYQRFFRRYRHLAGMTGTAREVAGELHSVYGLSVVTLRPHRRTRRAYRGTRIVRTEARKWARLARRVAAITKRGRPVLVATRTIAASEAASAALTEGGLAHEVLNATQDAEEGAIIARAGEAGRITVATNMAGRGVDIGLQPEVAAKGGLHVILTELHEARRIDRQAIGRSARQGERGSYEILLSWEDALVATFGGWRARLRIGGLGTFRNAQAKAERLHAQARLDLLRQDDRRDQQLTFTGSVE